MTELVEYIRGNLASLLRGGNIILNLASVREGNALVPAKCKVDMTMLHCDEWRLSVGDEVTIDLGAKMHGWHSGVTSFGREAEVAAEVADKSLMTLRIAAFVRVELPTGRHASMEEIFCFLCFADASTQNKSYSSLGYPHLLFWPGTLRKVEEKLRGG